MINKKAYTVLQKKWCMFIVCAGHEIYFYFLLFLLILYPSFSLGQEEPHFDEFNIYLNVPGVGGARVSALIVNNDAYLSISEVFTLLKIKNNPSVRFDSLTGFFINQQDEYLIDKVKNQIFFQGKKIKLKPGDLILTENNLYMKSGYFGEVFGLKCVFSYREFSVTLTTKLELPIIREKKLEQMRANLRRLQGEVKTDTTIGRSYPLLKFGMADWAIATMQQQGMNPYTQLNLMLGSVVAGGEMNVGLHYDQTNHFDSRQQFYLWRYVNNDHAALRQILVGKIMPQTISLLNGSLVGIQLTNTPSVYRRSFGTYTLSNITEPGWLVELYVNNVLVDYVKADASGFYKFEVPLVYGNSVMMVRMYGPWGEVRTRIETANIPFNFLPPGDLEYTVNAGVVENMPNSKFSRSTINYGVSKRISIGGGYEYFSSTQSENSMPFIGSSVMLLKNLLVSGEYTFGVRLKSSLSYRLPSNLQLDLNYTGYEKGQGAVKFAPHLEKGASISLPVQGRHFSFYSRVSLIQKNYSDIKTTNAVFLFSGNFHKISSNVTTTATFYDPKHVYTFSDACFLFRLPGQFTFMPSAQFDYSQERFVLVRSKLEKQLSGKGYLNISYEHNFVGKMSSLEVGLRYDFSFMQTGLASRLSKKANSFSQSATGSLLFDKKSNYIGASNTNKVGRGGLIFLAFLDLNYNGKKDENEPKILGLNLRINGGRSVRSDRDSTIRVIDLTPYTSYLVEVDANSIQSISWRIKKLTLGVSVDPNQFKTIEIPIEVMGEVSGTVNLKTKNISSGVGGVYVYFYQNNTTLVGRTITEDDGYFSFMGLQPGEYVARLDSNQLTKNQWTVSPKLKWFTVVQSKEGDVVDGLVVNLQSVVKESIENELLANNFDTLTLKSKTINNLNNISKGESQTDGVVNIDRPGYRNDNISQGVRYSHGFPGKAKTEQQNVSTLSGVRYSKGFPSGGMQDKKNDSAITGVKYSQGIPTRKIQAECIVLKAKNYVKSLYLKDESVSPNILKLDRNDQNTKTKRKQYTIQIGAFVFLKNAQTIQQEINSATGQSVIIVLDDGFYKVMIEGFPDRREAELIVKKLTTIGFDSFIKKINLK